MWELIYYIDCILNPHEFILAMGYTRDYILLLLSLLEHGKEVTCILTYMFAQASAEKKQIVFPLELVLISPGLERKKGNLELKTTFGLLSTVFCFCSEPHSQAFS